MLSNGEVASLSAVPVLSIDSFRDDVIRRVAGGAEMMAFFATPEPAARGARSGFQLFAVFADHQGGTLGISSARIERSWPSLTPDCESAHWFEREIAEQWNLQPEGHPWLKPIRFQPPMPGALPGRDSPPVGDMSFFRVEGDEIHEVAVGPVHAGVIEPGHFRFQCHGETVLHLEISLGYQHRGIERALVGGPGPRSVHYAETLAGDTTIGHATAYCEAVEALAWPMVVSPRGFQRSARSGTGAADQRALDAAVLVAE